MRPQVIEYRVPVHAAAPQAVALAVGLGWLHGKAINGSQDGNGFIRYGEPALGMRRKFTGYAFPPQIFTGYSARRVAGGAVRNQPASLPSTSTPDSLLRSPLQRAMATVGAAQLGGA